VRHLFESDELCALKSHVCQVLRRIENPGLPTANPASRVTTWRVVEGAAVCGYLVGLTTTTGTAALCTM
jgi:hypothetical protein